MSKHEYASPSQLDESPIIVLVYKQKYLSIKICLVRIHRYTSSIVNQDSTILVISNPDQSIKTDKYGKGGNYFPFLFF